MTEKIKDIKTLFETLGETAGYNHEEVSKLIDIDAFREMYTPYPKTHTINIGFISSLYHTNNIESVDSMLDSLKQQLKTRIETELKSQQFENPVASYGLATEPEDDAVLLFVVEESKSMPEQDIRVVSRVIQQLFDLRREQTEKRLEKQRQEKAKQEELETFVKTIESTDLARRTKNRLIKQYKVEHGLE